jgi:folate-binding Fe-S cluster repair protein YgfZ
MKAVAKDRGMTKREVYRLLLDHEEADPAGEKAAAGHSTAGGTAGE